MSVTMTIARLLLTFVGLLLTWQQITHLANDYDLPLATVYMGGLSVGLSVAIASWFYYTSHPYRHALLVFIAAFLYLCWTVSVPASEHVFSAKLYRDIQQEKLGPNAQLLQNISNARNNGVASLANQGILEGEKFEKAIADTRAAINDQEAQAMRVKNGGGAYDSQTEKALLGIEGAKLEGEARQEFLDREIRSKARRQSLGLELLEKCVNALAFTLSMFALLGRRPDDIMTPTAPVKKRQGVRVSP